MDGRGEESAGCGRVALAAGSAVAIINVDEARIEAILGCRPTSKAAVGPGGVHGGRVCAVAWLHRPIGCDDDFACGCDPALLGWGATHGFSPETHLICGCVDGSVRVWGVPRCANGSAVAVSEDELVLRCADSPVTAVAASMPPAQSSPAAEPSWIRESLHGSLIVATTADGPIFSWQYVEDKWVALTTLRQADTMRAECLALGFLPVKGAPPLLAAGCVDSKIRLFVSTGARESHAGWSEVLCLAGHQDWVRSLHFTPVGSAEEPLRLVSASNDCRVRLWRVQPDGSHVTDVASDVVRSEPVSALLESLTAPQRFAAYGTTFVASADAILAGHEDRVMCARWRPPRPSAGGRRHTQPACIVTASLDKSMILWEPERSRGSTGVWAPSARVGEVGGNTAGFVSCAMSPDATTVLAVGFRGSLHVWAAVSSGRSGDDAGAAEASVPTTWRPLATASGHFGAVTGIAWSSPFLESKHVVDCVHRYCLFSVSSDQTCRVFAPWLPHARAGSARASSSELSRKVSSWIEVARPQVHGYDLVCVCTPPVSGLPFCLVTGADEKILRVFEPPTVFFRSLSEAARTTVDSILTFCGDPVASSRPYAAYVPELGLSNKAVRASGEGAPTADGSAATTPAGASMPSDSHDGQHAREPFGASDAIVHDAAALVAAWPPTEEELHQSTLFPEIGKLYGHGDELLCVAAHPSGDLLASACKARNEASAAIVLWDTRTWHPAQAPLHGHKLSVVQLAWSPDGDVLLSVSKDRQICLYAATSGSSRRAYAPVVCIRKAHKRIIWSCSWSSCGSAFASGARDGVVKVWRVSRPSATETAVTAAAVLPVFPDSVTAVEFAPVRGFLAVGTERGDISVWYCADSAADGEWSSWQMHLRVSPSICPSARITNLSFCPEANDKTVVLAVSSEDHTVRLIELNTATEAHDGDAVQVC